MPAQTLPTITRAELASHNSKKSCYVAVGTRVFDVTEFLADHPGGEDLVMEYAGKDVAEILEDEISHKHSEAAYEILGGYVVGNLNESENSTSSSNGNGIGNDFAKTANGSSKVNGFAKTVLASEEDLSKETDPTEDFKKHGFIDLNRPMFMQVLRSSWTRDFYLDQVHRPRYYKGGDSAPFFGNFLEPLSKAPWWIVPTVWVPAVCYGLWRAYEGVQSLPLLGMNFVIGVVVWTLVEYTLHRCLFHLDEHMPDHPIFLTLHFMLHGVHHYLPMDKYRLVMPPALFLVLAYPFWVLVQSLLGAAFSWYIATNLYCGGIFGYILYDCTHYFLHHKNLPAYMRELKKYHLKHHYMDYQLGFGVTSKFWDKVFGTELVYSGSPKKA
ncbi:Inositolphosphorylceramide-B hydroxylase [Terfezia boudieri ATCC MYA-4762]|uniref:Ceramide very long chain fatty acid hydroxylase n=1 Tax=Terfezia boudieri ATCC MYA-4762 TaxID=1051890 RepID=A0A3N4LQ71_9PEZI|nr:Inositolphosphorylceramide-B hydroxylase [Terfezia boudieri ATCC MYA-4762]